MKSFRLPLHEWCIISLFCAILMTLASFAFGQQKQLPILTSSESSEKSLQVRIEGQVAKPGLYSFPLGATVKDLVAQAEPLSSADLSKIKWRRQLLDDQTIQIPERRWITIEVTGAVSQPGSLRILSGTRSGELADQLQFLPEADIKRLQKGKRFLQDGDRVVVYVKKVREKKKKETEITKKTKKKGKNNELPMAQLLS